MRNLIYDKCPRTPSKVHREHLCCLSHICQFASRFAKMLFYHSHLPRCEVAVALLVAHAYQGIMQTLGVSYFLSEASYGRNIAQVGIVTHGGTAEGHSSFSCYMFHICLEFRV